MHSGFLWLVDPKYTPGIGIDEIDDMVIGRSGLDSVT